LQGKPICTSDSAPPANPPPVNSPPPVTTIQSPAVQISTIQTLTIQAPTIEVPLVVSFSPVNPLPTPPNPTISLNPQPTANDTSAVLSSGESTPGQNNTTLTATLGPASSVPSATASVAAPSVKFSSGGVRVDNLDNVIATIMLGVGLLGVLGVLV
jgi:hypothetical protein